MERALASAAAERARAMSHADDEPDTHSPLRPRALPLQTLGYNTEEKRVYHSILIPGSTASKRSRASPQQPGEMRKRLPENPDEMVNCYEHANLVRSEVLQLLETKTKDVTLLEKEMMKLEDRLQTAEAKREEVHLRNQQLEAQAARLRCDGDSRHKLAAEEASNSERRLMVEMERVTDVTKRLEETRQELAQAQSQARKLKSALTLSEEEAGIAAAQANQQHQDLMAEVQDVRASLLHSNDQSRQLRMKVDQLQDQVQMLEEERDAAGSAQQQAEREAKEQAGEVARLQHMVTVLNSSSSQGSGLGVSAREQELEATVKMLRDELASFEAEVASARTLQKHQQSVSVLLERSSAAEKRAKLAESRLEEELERAHKAHTEAMQHHHWPAKLQSLPGVETPEDVLHLLGNLQNEVASSQAAAGEARQNVARLTVEIEHLKVTAKEHEYRYSTAATALADAEINAQASERRATLLAQEKASLQKMLNSYENEHVMKTPPGSASKIEGAVKERNAELEESLTHAHAQIASLSKALNESGATSADARKNLEVLSIRTEEAEAKCASLERENGSLAKELAMLEMKVGRGEFDRKTTKVLHFKMNPEKEALKSVEEKELDGLKVENGALKASLEALEKRLTSSNSSADPHAEGAARMAVVEAEAAVAKRRVSDLEKREERYKQIFKQKIQTFREACYKIFGYKVEMKDASDGDTTFVLRSIFTDESDTLIFTYKQTGEVILENSAYSTEDNEVKKMVDTFVNRFRSIPGFTANLTMEQFNRHTLAC